MAVIKFLFYISVYLLIRLGDFVHAFISSLVSTSHTYSRTIHKDIKNILSHSLDTVTAWVKRLKKPSLHIPRPQYQLRFNFPRIASIRSKKIHKRSREIPSAPVLKYSAKTKLKFFSLGVVLSMIVVFLPALLYLFMLDLPTLDGLSVAQIPKTTKIFDRNGELLYEFYANQNRTIVSLNDIPDYLEEATIAIEDQNFYHHPGFDIQGIVRAIYVNLTEGQLQGGSTITQQLIKSALLTPEPTLIRKSKEIVLSLLAEQKYTKDEILELYFNYIPYGGTAWGVQAAANDYFGKDVKDVDLAEAAFLAGLPKAPSQYSPYLSTDNAWKKRQWDVLSAMVRDGYITSREAREAYNESLSFQSPKTAIKAPHFVMYVKEELVKRYGLYEVERGGLQVVTSLDLSLQRRAEELVKKTVYENQYLGIGNAAALVTDPRNGDVLAMVGSQDFFDTEHDGNVNLTTALRQPGSTIKVVTYAAALSNGFTEGSVLLDVPTLFRVPGSSDYRPVNYDGQYHGPVPLRIALANSYNIPAVRITEKLGVNTVVDFGRRMGITSWSNNKPYGLSVTLGGNEVTMLDLASVYGTVANSGYRVDPDPIISVKDSRGRIIDQKEPEPEQVLSPGVAFILSDILSDNTARSRAFGVNSPLNIPGRNVSVKTGTTDNKRDNWTVGFTKEYVVATWVGNNDNTPLSPTLASGITGAAPLWRSIMESLVSDSPVSQEEIPGSVVERKCFGYDAYFIKGTEESTPCRLVRPSPTAARQ